MTEQDFIILNKLAEQQKNQPALKIKTRILKQTHDANLAEPLCPLTKKLDVINDTTKKLGEVTEKSQPENSIPQSANKNTSTNQPTENDDGLICGIRKYKEEIEK